MTDPRRGAGTWLSLNKGEGTYFGSIYEEFAGHKKNQENTLYSTVLAQVAKIVCLYHTKVKEM